MSNQAISELLLEYAERGKLPNPNASRVQIAKADLDAEGRYFLNKLVKCTGTWQSYYRRDFLKAQREGRSPTEQKYFLNGEWVIMMKVDQRINIRLLNKIGGLKGIIGKDPDPGLYWFLEMRTESDLGNIPYYEPLWAFLAANDGLTDPSPEIVSVLKQKPKLVLSDQLLVPFLRGT